MPEQIKLEIDSEGKGTTWLDLRHSHYQKNRKKWEYAWDHYTGDVLLRDKITDYLIRKAQAESEQAYLERMILADYSPHFSAVVDALAGMLFAVEGDASRFMGDVKQPGLGEFDDPDSPMHRLWRNCDGHGTGWITFFKQLAIDLTVAHDSWLIVDQDYADQAVIRRWPALSVVNWIYDEDTGLLSEVLIREDVDTRKTLKEKAKQKAKQRYVLYTMDGWERWEKTEKGTAIRIGGETYGQQFVNEEGEAILPIFPAKLPMIRHVGWLLAKKANAIFNKESERDQLLRAANFPLLLIVGSDAQFKKSTEDLKTGVRALRQDPQYGTAHQFITPPSEAAAIANTVLERKVEEFYVVGFRDYGDAAQEKTATEVRQDVAGGVGAFLGLLKAGVDDSENEALKRIAQIEYPNDNKRWFVNKVVRSETFVPTDVATIIQHVKERYFHKDQPLPLGPTGIINVAKQVAQYDGIQIDEAEIKGAVMTGELQRLVDLFKDLPITAEIRVRATLDLLVTLGYVDPEATEKLEDGSEVSIIKSLEEEMLDLALADDEARKRMAQPLDMGPPEPEPKQTPPFDEEDEE